MPRKADPKWQLFPLSSTKSTAPLVLCSSVPGMPSSFMWCLRVDIRTVSRQSAGGPYSLIHLVKTVHHRLLSWLFLIKAYPSAFATGAWFPWFPFLPCWCSSAFQKTDHGWSCPFSSWAVLRHTCGLYMSCVISFCSPAQRCGTG